jgi:hypothetical protein
MHEVSSYRGPGEVPEEKAPNLNASQYPIESWIWGCAWAFFDSSFHICILYNYILYVLYIYHILYIILYIYIYNILYYIYIISYIIYILHIILYILHIIYNCIIIYYIIYIYILFIINILFYMLYYTYYLILFQPMDPNIYQNVFCAFICWSPIFHSFPLINIKYIPRLQTA